MLQKIVCDKKERGRGMEKRTFDIDGLFGWRWKCKPFKDNRDWKKNGKDKNESVHFIYFYLIKCNSVWEIVLKTCRSTFSHFFIVPDNEINYWLMISVVYRFEKNSKIYSRLRRKTIDEPFHKIRHMNPVNR